jgi:hypothetical protein
VVPLYEIAQPNARGLKSFPFKTAAIPTTLAAKLPHELGTDPPGDNARAPEVARLNMSNVRWFLGNKLL